MTAVAESISTPRPAIEVPASPVQAVAAPRMSLRARAKRTAQTLVGYGYDMARFMRHSSTVRPERDEASLDAHITMDFHRLEKGLALAEPKPGFGAEVVQRLLRNVLYSELRFGDTPATLSARAALGHYLEHAQRHGIDARGVADFLASRPFSAHEGGTLSVSRTDIHARAKRDLDPFFFSRHSVRQFTGEPVSEDAVERAVRVAIRSPSVCNRQAARAHALVERGQIDSALSIQGGNRGFGHRIGCLMLVTVDLRKFVSSAERYQAWIDGGLFAMSLCYGFHAQGLGTCMLNWSVNPRIDVRLRRAVTLPDAEAVITMMAVGHLPETFSVARSPRLTTSAVLTVHR